MKQIYLISIFLIFTSVVNAVGQPSSAEMDNFVAKVDSYCKTSDTKSIQKLYFFEGVPEELQDILIYDWENLLIHYKEHYGMKYESAEYIPLNDYLASLENSYEVIDFIKPTSMNGKTYVSNLDVIGVVSVTLSIPSGGLSHSLFAIGVSKDSKLYFTAPQKIN